MGKRIFAEVNCDLRGKVLPVEQFRLFADLEKGFRIPEFRRAALIEKAEIALDQEIPSVLAADYMLFSKTGNRSIFEDKYFARRTMLLDLTIGEYVEKKGRFAQKLTQVLWAILEESSWIIPAHNRLRPSNVHAALPMTHKANYIDLFSAATGAAVAVAYYFHKPLLENAPYDLGKRIGYELDRQLWAPFLDDKIMRENCKWSGLSGNKVNNWCPWIITNLLTVCALTQENTDMRTQILERALPILDRFAEASPADGGCDEGPRYWELAGGSLWAACLLARDMTGGYVDVLHEPLLKNMGEYEVKMLAAPGFLLNFADAPVNYAPNSYLLYHWGKTCRSETLVSCAGALMDGEPETDRRTPYKYLRYLTTPQPEKRQIAAPEKAYIESLQIAITRPSGQLGKGMYLAVKGGHNGESHNHNDLGNIVVFSDDLPIFIDVGVGEYTKRYFGPERYDVWFTRSDYHNSATFNGITQQAGTEYFAEATYDPEFGGFSLLLAKGYPTNAGLKDYQRSAVLKGDRIIVTDHVQFHKPGTVAFHFMTIAKPENVEEGSFRLLGKTVKFDPQLSLSVDEPDLMIPEAEPIPGFWGVEKLYRITLTTKEKLVENTFVLTIE